MCNSARGFVALMTVVILGAMLTVMVFSIGVATFFSRLNVVEREYKRTSLAYAEGCLEKALLDLARGVNVATGCINFDTNQPTYMCDMSTKGLCRVCTSLSAPVSLPAVLSVRGYYRDAFTNLEILVTRDLAGYHVIKWQEMANGDPNCAIH